MPWFVETSRYATGSYVYNYALTLYTDVMIVTSAARLMEILTVVQLLNCGGYGKSKFY